MDNQPQPFGPRNPFGPNPVSPENTGSTRINYGVENNSYVVNNYFGPAETAQAPAPEPVQPAAVSEPTDYLGRTAHTVRKRKRWAWAGIILGAMMLLGSITGGGGAAGFLSGIFIGGAMFLPGYWWHRCERADRTALAEWEKRTQTNSQLKEMLGDEYATVTRGMGTDPRPEPVDRKWPMIATAAVVLAVVGGMFTP